MATTGEIETTWASHATYLRDAVANYADHQQSRLEAAYRRPTTPYMGLYWYDMEDAAVFHGREADVANLLHDHLSGPRESNRIIVLHGLSGVGKTSLLMAGLGPALLQNGQLILPVRVSGSPVAPIFQSVLVHGPADSYRPDYSGMSLRDFFRIITLDLGGSELVILLDQFEELFLELPPVIRQTFLESLSECLEDPDLPIRLVLSVRDEYLYTLSALKPYVPNIFHNLYHLGPLSDDALQRAILAPAKTFSLHVEHDLLKALMDDQGALSRSLHVQGASTTLLVQLACHELYLRRKHSDLTLTAYKDLGRLTGIRDNYMRRRMESLDDETLGWALLGEFVTPHKTHRPLSYETISGRMMHRASTSLIGELLNQLAEVHLLRRRRQSEDVLYEVAHEFMVDSIVEHLSPLEMKVKALREMLHTAETNWRMTHSLIDDQTLDVLARQSSSLRGVSETELDILLRSSLATGRNVELWLGMAAIQDSDIKPHEYLINSLESPNFRERVGAVMALASQAEELTSHLVPLLADPYPQVRAAVIRALNRANISENWHKHLVYEVYVPEGPFVMGSDPEQDPEARDDEQPPRVVTLAPYYISKYPITNADWKRYVDDVPDAYIPADWHNDTYPVGREDHPVRYLSWYAVHDYAEWAGMRMPTEAEWEKAARGQMVVGIQEGSDEELKVYSTPHGRIYPWGDQWKRSLCNIAEGAQGDTTPVGVYGEKSDSPYGCSDMAGNVWEWVADWYRWNYYAAGPLTNPPGPEEGTERVLRGGSFADLAVDARCTRRQHLYPSATLMTFGGRVAVPPAPPRGSLLSDILNEESKEERD